MSDAGKETNTAFGSGLAIGAIFAAFLIGGLVCNSIHDRETVYGKQHCKPKCESYRVEFDGQAWRCFCATDEKAEATP